MEYRVSRIKNQHTSSDELDKHKAAKYGISEVYRTEETRCCSAAARRLQQDNFYTHLILWPWGISS